MFPQKLPLQLSYINVQVVLIRNSSRLQQSTPVMSIAEEKAIINTLKKDNLDTETKNNLNG